MDLMRGTLEASFEKSGKVQTRSLEDDRRYMSPSGAPFSLKGRALLLVRNVGHLMTTSMVRWQEQDAPEGVIDAFATALIGRASRSALRANSAAGSIYVVKPKMHGPDEARFTSDLFSACERSLACHIAR